MKKITVVHARKQGAHLGRQLFSIPKIRVPFWTLNSFKLILSLNNFQRKSANGL
jgi:hypothetical protein